ncbi:MAG: hypothetical protein L6365_10995 [Desulfobulbaceae bacterium]|nr:hypothetical protein [Pseudomonadota bacterium]MCG2748047.1 hypothetical protein [Desulfobulbaceae bacterium]
MVPYGDLSCFLGTAGKGGDEAINGGEEQLDTVAGNKGDGELIFPNLVDTKLNHFFLYYPFIFKILLNYASAQYRRRQSSPWRIHSPLETVHLQLFLP